MRHVYATRDKFNSLVLLRSCRRISFFDAIESSVSGGKCGIQNVLLLGSRWIMPESLRSRSQRGYGVVVERRLADPLSLGNFYVFRVLQ